jgi:hypothetical protein
MNTINTNASDYLGFTQKLVKRNTAIQLIDAKQSGDPINKQQLQESNQAIKDKSVDAGLAIYQTNSKKNTIDTYIQASDNANNSNSSSTQEPNEISSFDASAVNDARSTAQRRAVGISVYEQIQSIKE